MKSNLPFLACILLLLLHPGRVFAQVSGSQLEVGPSGSNQVIDTMGLHSGAIGTSNDVRSTNSFTVGYLNDLAHGVRLYGGISAYNYVFGRDNETTGWSTFVFGSANRNFGEHSAILGLQNINDGYGSLVAGQLNVAEFGADRALVSGMNNVVEAPTNVTGTIGRGLINKWSYSTVVGSYNDETAPGSLRFAVGVGTGNPADGVRERANALEVYADGTIIMAAQGDISMGEFGAVNP